MLLCTFLYLANRLAYEDRIARASADFAPGMMKEGGELSR